MGLSIVVRHDTLLSRWTLYKVLGQFLHLSSSRCLWPVQLGDCDKGKDGHTWVWAHLCATYICICTWLYTCILKCKLFWCLLNGKQRQMHTECYNSLTLQPSPQSRSLWRPQQTHWKHSSAHQSPARVHPYPPRYSVLNKALLNSHRHSYSQTTTHPGTEEATHPLLLEFYPYPTSQVWVYLSVKRFGPTLRRTLVYTPGCQVH